MAKTVLFADKALLADGWARSVALTIADGSIEGIATGVSPERADERCALVVPGLVNAHSHAFQRALVGHTEHRGPRAVDTFWTWRDRMYRLAERLDAGSLEAIAAELYAEMLAAGYTTVVEFHYLLGGDGGDTDADALLAALLAAAERTGIRLVYVPVLYERGGFDGRPLSGGQQRFALALDSLLAHVDSAGRRLGARHRVGVGAHSLRAVTPRSLATLAEFAADRDLPMHLHIAEQPAEVEQCVAATGRRPVAWLMDACEVGRRWTLVHATHLDDEELQAVAASGAVVCLCPSTEGNLGDGLFRLGEFLGAGGRFSIGSDSHVSVDPFEELRWLEYGSRLATGERNVAALGGQSSGTSLVRRAVAGGAQSAGLDAGGLAAGAPADLLALDERSAALAGHDETTLLDALVFAGQPIPVGRVMVDGEWRIGEGGLPEREAILENYRRALARLDIGAEAAS